MRTTTLKYGFMMFVAIGLFFVVMNLVGLGRIPELRVLNIFIVIYFTNKLAKKNLQRDDGDTRYLTNLLSLFAANTMNVFLSLIGFTIYVKLIDTDYLSVVVDSMMWMPTTNLVEILIALFFEGMAGTAIVSFAVMQYWKDYRHTHETAPE